MKIKKIERITLDKPVPVYDLTVDNLNHNFALSLDDGTTAFTHNCDEISEKGVTEALSLLNALDNRFSSRFQGSDIVFQSVVSSAKTENSAMGEYLRRLPKDDPSIVRLSPCLWEVKPDPNFVGDGSTFPVLVGNGSIPSKIITDPGELKAIEDDKYETPPGCVLINVPTVYKSKFELQLDQSIQDIAGMTTSDNNMVFRDTSDLEDPILLPELSLEVNIKDNFDILAALEKHNLFEQNINGNWQFKRAPKAPRYCHIDLSGSGDQNQCDTGLCILHKEWKLNPITNQKDTIYVVDLLLFISAKTKVDIHAIQNFLIKLVTDKNAPIHTVSFDQWQSLLISQLLEASGCFNEVTKVSVDSKADPYQNAVHLVESGLVKIGNCPKLKEELHALVWEKGKVERTTKLKDGPDALCGSLYDAQLNYSDVPVYEYYEPKSITPKDKFEKFIEKNNEYLIDL